MVITFLVGFFRFSFSSFFCFRMNSDNLQLAQQLIGPSYRQVAEQAQKKREKLLTTLLSQQRLPTQPWDALSIQTCLHDLAAMDSNTFPTSVGVGEREGRIFGGIQGLVGQRYYGMTHGIGRSGDIVALQPKAAGSSLLSRLVHQMTLHLLRDLGVKSTQSVLVMPLATASSE